MHYKNKILLAIFISIIQMADAEIINNKDINILSMNNIKTTKVDIYPQNTYITQDFDCKLDNDNTIKLEFNNPELQNSELQIYFDDGTDKIPASKINYINAAMDEDLIYQSWIGKTVEIMGGGLGATVLGVLETYEHRKAFIKGNNDRQYLIDFNDPQGFKVFLKGSDKKDKSPYKQIIKASFISPKNNQGSLIMYYKTPLVTSSIYYTMQKEDDNYLDINLRVKLQNNSNILFANTKIKIINDNYIINLNAEKQDYSKLLVTNNTYLPLIDASDFMKIDVLYPKNTYDLLVKEYKNINFTDAYVLDMSVPHTKKHESMYITNHSLILKQKEIMPTAKLFSSVVSNKKTMITENSEKTLAYNKNTGNIHVVAETSNTVLINHSRNNALPQKNISTNLPDYQDLHWKTIIHNQNNFSVEVLVIYNKHYTIKEVSSGKLVSNNCIQAQIPANSKKEVLYRKLTNYNSNQSVL